MTTLQLGDYQIITIVTDEPWCENCYLVRHLPSEEQLSYETVVFPGHGRRWTIGEAKAWWRNAVISPAQYTRFGAI